MLLLLTYSNKSTGLLIAAVVFDHIGLTPLLLATLGMLSRLYDLPLPPKNSYFSHEIPPRVDQINAGIQTSITIKYFRLVQLAVVVGAVLGIVGAEQAQSSSSPSTITYIAVLCYVAAYAVIVLIFCLALPYTRDYIIDSSERTLAPAIGLALPLVLVRLAYQVLVVFVHRGVFSRLGQGSVAVHVAMAVVEEILVVMIYIYMGFRLGRLEVNEQGPILSRSWKRSKGGRRNRSRRRDRSMRGERGGGYTRGTQLQSIGVE